MAEDTTTRMVIGIYEVRQLPSGNYGLFYANTDLRAYTWMVWPRHDEAVKYARRIESRTSRKRRRV